MNLQQLFHHINTELQKRKQERDIKRACERYGNEAKELYQNIDERLEEAIIFARTWMPWLLMKEVVKVNMLMELSQDERKDLNVVTPLEGHTELHEGRWTVIDQEVTTYNLCEVHAFGWSKVQMNDQGFCVARDYTNVRLKSGIVHAFNYSTVDLMGEGLVYLFDYSLGKNVGTGTWVLEDYSALRQVSSDCVVLDRTQKS